MVKVIYYFKTNLEIDTFFSFVQFAVAFIVLPNHDNAK